MSTVGKAYIQIIPTTKNIKSMLERSVVAPAMGVGNKAGQAVGQGINKGVTATSRSFGSFLKPVTDSLGLMGIAAAKLGDHFSQSMNIVKASTNAPQTAIRSLSEEALKLGTKGIGSANDVAVAMEKMARAGMDTNEIMKGTAPIMKLAAAAQVDVSETAAIAVNHLKEFGLTVNDLPHSMDVMGKLIKTTGTDLSSLAEAFKYAAPTAKQAGIDFNQAAAMIGVLARAGIHGSMAGTALRRMIVRLTAPTDKAATIIDKYGIKVKDASGKMRNLADIMSDFKNAGLSDKEMKDVFGIEGLTAAQILMRENGKAMREMEENLKNSHGTVDKLIKAYNTTLSGGVKQIKDSISTMITSFSVGGLSSVQAVFGTIVLGVNKIAEAVVMLGLKFPILKDQIFSVALSFGLFKTMPRILLTIGQGLEKAGFAGKGLMKVLLTFSRIGNIFALIMVPLSFLAPLFKKAYAQSDVLRDAVHKLGKAFGTLWGSLKDLGKAILWAWSKDKTKGLIDFRSFTESSVKVVQKLTKVVTSAADKVKQWAYDLHTPGTNANKIFNLIKSTIDDVILALKIFTKIAVNVFKNVITQVKDIVNWFNKLSSVSKVTITITIASALIAGQIAKIINLLKAVQLTRKATIIIGIIGFELLDTLLKKFDYFKKNNTIRTFIEVVTGAALLRLGVFLRIIKSVPSVLMLRLSIVFASFLVFKHILDKWEWLKNHSNIELSIAGLGAIAVSWKKIRVLILGIFALLKSNKIRTIGFGVSAALIGGIYSGLIPLKGLGNKIAGMFGLGAVKQKMKKEGGDSAKFFITGFTDSYRGLKLFTNIGSEISQQVQQGLSGKKNDIQDALKSMLSVGGTQQRYLMNHFQEMGYALSQQLIMGMKSNDPEAQATAENQFRTILECFENRSPEMQKAIDDLVANVPKGIRQGGQSSKDAMQQLMTAIEDTMVHQDVEFGATAKALMDNFVNGIRSGNEELKQAGKAGLLAYLQDIDVDLTKDKANEIVNTLVDALDSQSPYVKEWGEKFVDALSAWRHGDIGEEELKQILRDRRQELDYVNAVLERQREEQSKSNESTKTWSDTLKGSVKDAISKLTELGGAVLGLKAAGANKFTLSIIVLPIMMTELDDFLKKYKWMRKHSNVRLAIEIVVGALTLAPWITKIIKNKTLRRVIEVGLKKGKVAALIAMVLGKKSLKKVIEIGLRLLKGGGKAGGALALRALIAAAAGLATLNPVSIAIAAVAAPIIAWLFTTKSGHDFRVKVKEAVDQVIKWLFTKKGNEELKVKIAETVDKILTWLFGKKGATDLKVFINETVPEFIRWIKKGTVSLTVTIWGKLTGALKWAYDHTVGGKTIDWGIGFNPKFPTMPGPIIVPPTFHQQEDIFKARKFDVPNSQASNYQQQYKNITFDALTNKIEKLIKELKEQKQTINNLTVNAKTEIDQRRLMKDMSWELRHLGN